MAKCRLSLEYLKVTEAMAKCNQSLNYSQKIFWSDWTTDICHLGTILAQKKIYKKVKKKVICFV